MSTDMFRAETATDSPVCGIPGVTGRWQPTRAGVLNSWKWTDEEFQFADGWLAFIGRNGSGKSLTASQLVTVLLDGDTSQTALSVSGRAAGTLMSRHTDNRDKDDKTGVWWLEYGRTDPVTGATEYVTTGLWLRSSGQSLLRAFFLVPARVGDELTLQIDRNAVSIDRLAEQLADYGGELFTDAQRLRPKAAAHLSSIGAESGYRTAVRTRLFAPLDELQYDALLSVLRTLRSVRTAEKISAREMLDVLTSALPALDQGKMREIATAMQRIATLESQLADTTEQAKKLAATDRVYELYRRAVALTVAAALRSANTDFDNLTRSERTAEKELGDALSIIEQQQEALKQAKFEVSRLEGEVRAAETALRDHAGAELPHLEQRAKDLDTSAASAEERAEQGRSDAVAASATAAQADRDAIASQQSLTKAVQELSRTGGAIAAESVLTRLVSTAEELARPDQLDPDAVALSDIPVDEIATTPLEWVRMRRDQVEEVSGALGTLGAANRTATDAADEHRAAQDEVDRRDATLSECVTARSTIEQQLDTAITAWQQTTEFFPPVPDALLDPDPIEGRVDPARLTAWLDQQAGAIRDRLDVPSHRVLKTAADDAANRAAAFASDQKTAAHKAADAVVEVKTRYDEHCQQNLIADESEARTEHQAELEHNRLVDAAREHRHMAIVEQLDRTEDALRALLDWSDGVRNWRSDLQHLGGDWTIKSQLPTTDPQELLTELSAARTQASGGRLDRTASPVAVADRSLSVLADYDDGPLHAAVAEAAQTAVARLNRRLAEADHDLDQRRERVDETTAELLDARRAPLPPTAPNWRTRSNGSPLWSLINFHEDIPADLRNRCEGALLVSGILDAVVTVDGRARVGDTVLTGISPVRGPNLADLLTVEPDSPIDPAVTVSVLRSISFVDSVEGTTVQSGVLTAAAPTNYTCRYIGTTARERARAERIADLESRLELFTAELESALRERQRCQDAIAEANAEQESLPSSAPWKAARSNARTAQGAAHTADHEAAELHSRADADLRSVRDTLAAARRARTDSLATVGSEVDTARALAQQAEDSAAHAAEKAEEATEFAVLAAARLENAVAGQNRTDDDQRRFPSLEALFDALAEEDDATQQLTTARTQVVTTAERLRRAQAKSRQSLLALNRAVDLGEGRMLPTDRAALKNFSSSLTQLFEQVHTWQRCIDRALNLCARARTSAAASLNLSKRADRQSEEATNARAAALSEAATVAQMRELHGAEYEQLRRALTESTTAYENAQTHVEEVRDEIHRAEVAAAGARSTLENIAPQREQAELGRERCLRQMNRLVDERIATVDNDIPVDAVGRPTNLTAALAWGTSMLAAEPRAYPRDELAKLLENRRVRLEAEAKKTSTELVRFDRQVTLQTIPGTDWRRAVVAAPDALIGEDLHETVMTLQQTAEQLQRDLRDDVKNTLKTSMFTALRREIATRRAAAQELVRQIRSTLAGVRTGVARVGVEVDWKVKSDPDAQKMIELVSALPSDETFQQMYDVLRQRLEDATGDTWEARVAHTFDYRVWHEWDIKVTHASFGDGATEVFRPLTARTNPLASFSTGEMRLATMLPLLAAAWSMYGTPDYQGPRLLFVDEMNAAFDPQNVRKLLALLRKWNFDVLSTAPEMSAMLKAEAERVMIAQVTHSGDVRVVMPWLWTGSGQPVLIAEGIGNTAELS